MGGIMKNKHYLTLLTALVAALGISQTVIAEPDGSQRLRGLGDRVFWLKWRS